LDTCHFCGKPTLCHPVVDWQLGRLYFPICHACSGQVDLERLYVSVHLASDELLARAHMFGTLSSGDAVA
jgi:hypothetical protein